MGKKVKIGKTRKDKFYQLAKESGYRSRAAFKLLQLNRTYHFLDKARICVDLCAAPGGWLQVASTHMPMSSIIIGVDLAPIRPIGNVITHLEDITTPKCRMLLKKDLNDAKADVILHDGAPNVGKNWIHDAYQQNILVLQSFKLASEFLRKGGWFITKVFRSQDYFSLLWIFQQLFKKVDSTKPQASRNESAEIFVVCQNFLAPDHIDEKFFDIKYVFDEAKGDQNQTQQSSANLLQTLMKPKLNQRNRGGYADNDYTLFHRLKATEFVKSNNFIVLLSNHQQIEIDDDRIKNHAATTNEMKECLNDLRVLGANEIKNILRWRVKIKQDLFKSEPVAAVKTEEKQVVVDESEDDEKAEEEDIDQEIVKTVDHEKKVEKKKRKKLMKEKRKIRDKIALKMENPEDMKNFDLQNERELFSLSKIKTKKQLLELQNELPGLELSDDEHYDEEDNIDIESGLSFKRKKKGVYTKEDGEDLDDFYAPIEHGNDGGANDDELNGKDIEESDIDDVEEGPEDDEEEDNPLITDLVTDNKADRKKLVANSWFNKSAFDFLKDTDETDNLINELDDDDDVDDDEKKRKEAPKRVYHSDSEDDIENKESKKLEGGIATDSDSDSDDGEESSKPKKKVKLTPYELAVGEMIVNSKEAKSLLIDESYNRYSNFGDPDGLPKWFVDDEKLHFNKDLSVSSDIIGKYKQKAGETINTRPIKKVVEAEARKKRRMSKKLDKARKKTEAIGENLDMTDKERQKEIKNVYKRAGLLGKKKADVKYVVAKRTAGKRGVAGKIKGPYKVVDQRLKKDKRNARKSAKKNKNSKKAGVKKPTKRLTKKFKPK